MRGRTTIPSSQKLVSDHPHLRLMIYDFHQDDPRKCTSARLHKFQLVQRLNSLAGIPYSAILLNPTSHQTLSNQDRPLVKNHGLVGLDCSWNSSEKIFQKRIKGEHRKLPILLAGNPTNYSVKEKLSTAEAIAASLIITGFSSEAQRILSLFKWGETFLTLNKDPLEAYSRSDPQDIFQLEREFFETRSSP